MSYSHTAFLSGALVIGAKQTMGVIRDLDRFVEHWSRGSGDTQEISALLELIELLRLELYNEYQPFPRGPTLSFQRLVNWLGNVRSEKDRRLFFEFVPFLLFIGRCEMETMYRAAD